MLLILIVTLSILLMLIRPRGIAEVWWVGSGASLLIAFRLISLADAGKAIAKGTDVYLFLIGMMLLSELAREHGVFDWIAATAVRLSRGQCNRLFALVYAAGTLVTICMSNDATAVVLTPAILTVIRKAKVQPLPFLFACALIANAASFVLPISNPANLVVFRGNMPSLAHWLAAFIVPSVLSIATTYAVLKLLFRQDLCERIETTHESTELKPEGKLVLAGLLAVVAVLLAASAFDLNLGLPTCIAAVLITAIVSIKQKQSPIPLLREISWSTLLLVAALFILVEAVTNIGALRYTSAALQWTQHLAAAPAAVITAFAVGISNNIVNNLPLGLIAGATVQSANIHGLLANAVLIGVDLGPNLSVTGSLATILWLIALRKEKIHVSAWSFLKIGAVAMPAAMLASVAGLLLIHSIAS